MLWTCLRHFAAYSVAQIQLGQYISLYSDAPTKENLCITVKTKKFILTSVWLLELQVDITQLQVSQVGSLGCYECLEFYQYVAQWSNSEHLLLQVYTQLHVRDETQDKNYSCVSTCAVWNLCKWGQRSAIEGWKSTVYLMNECYLWVSPRRQQANFGQWD